MISIYLNLETGFLTVNRDEVLVGAQRNFSELDPFLIEVIFKTLWHVTMNQLVIATNEGCNLKSPELRENMINFLSNMIEKKHVPDCDNRIYQGYRDYLKCLLSGEGEQVSSYLKSHNFDQDDIDSWKNQALRILDVTVFLLDSQKKGIELYMQGHRPPKDLKSAVRIKEWGKFYHSPVSAAPATQKVSFGKSNND